MTQREGQSRGFERIPLHAGGEFGFGVVWSSWQRPFSISASIAFDAHVHVLDGPRFRKVVRIEQIDVFLCHTGRRRQGHAQNECRQRARKAQCAQCDDDDEVRRLHPALLFHYHENRELRPSQITSPAFGLLPSLGSRPIDRLAMPLAA